MPQQDQSIPIIRRSVASSLKNLQSMFQADSKLKNSRPLRYESLEDRRVLSATGFEPSVDLNQPDSAFFASDNYGDSSTTNQTDSIVRLLVDVNGEQMELTPANSLLELVAGDTVKVVEIEFNSTAISGVFAAEGFVNKISDLTSASMIDYNDGRFSERASNQEATGGEGAIGGLSESWTVETGWDRMSINLIHYTENATGVAGRFFVNLQVGQPGFEFDTSVLDQISDQVIHAGDEVTIPARWLEVV